MPPEGQTTGEERHPLPPQGLWWRDNRTCPNPLLQFPLAWWRRGTVATPLLSHIIYVEPGGVGSTERLARQMGNVDDL